MTLRHKLTFQRAVPLILLAGLVPLGGPICRPAAPPDGDGDECTYTTLGSDITSDTTLPAGCYDVTGILEVSAGLTIQPGSTLRFQAGCGLEVTSTGYLNAVGTSGSAITFTGATASRGFWRDIRFSGSASTNNRLEYVTIEYAGTTDGGALLLDGDVNAVAVVLAHCTIRQSAGYGFVGSGNFDLTDFASNTITQNTQGPCMLPPNAVQYLDLDSSYTGNDQTSIVLDEGSVTDSQIWADLGVGYLATNIQVVGELTLSPGVTIAFTSAGVMNVQSTGSLRAVGAPGRDITLTGATQTAGFWQGLSYTNTSAAGNNLTLVTIEYGGATSGNLILSEPPVLVAASNCTFAHSGNCGIYVASGGTINNDVATANTFTDNPGGDVCP